LRRFAVRSWSKYLHRDFEWSAALAQRGTTPQRSDAFMHFERQYLANCRGVAARSFPEA
jgi:hypothetical protein